MKKLTGKNVLVTGGAGFIGSHLVDRIVKENPANLVVVDSFFLGKEENLNDARKDFPDLHLYRLDASDLAAMQELVNAEKTEVVFNLAVIPLPTSLHYPTWTIETNVGIATTFCDLARWGHIETLVHCSSSESYGTAQFCPMDESHPLLPSTPYAASKAASDLIVQSYHETFGIDTVVVRPFNNFGPRQNPGTYAGIIPIVVRKVKMDEPVEIYGDGEQTRDFVFVKDTAAAMIRAYEEVSTRGQVINVATGHETSVNRLVSMLLDVLGNSDHPVVHTSPRPGDVRRHLGGVNRMRDMLGIEIPGIREDNLRETVEWYLRIIS